MGNKMKQRQLRIELVPSTPKISDLYYLSQPVHLEIPGFVHETFHWESEDGKEDFLIDITSVKQFIVSMGLCAPVNEFKFENVLMGHLTKFVEMEAVFAYRLGSRDDCPGIMTWMDDRPLLIDGHWRAARRWKAGLRSMRVFDLPASRLDAFLCGERDKQTARNMRQAG